MTEDIFFMTTRSKSKNKPQGKPARKIRESELMRVSGGTTGHGFEIIDGRKIPYDRQVINEVQTWTLYGSLDGSDHSKGVSLLTKHELRGAVSWGLNLNVQVIKTGATSTKSMQGLWGNSEAMEMLRAVYNISFHSDEYCDFHAEYSTGSIIRGAILSAIQTGNPRKLNILSKCVEALPAYKLTTRREHIANAVEKSANLLNKVPTYKEAFESLSDDCKDDEGNFCKGLVLAGFGWLLSSKR